MRRVWVVLAGACVIVIAVGGCGGYRVGTLLPEHIKTIAVPAFVNKTGEPNLEIGATTAVNNRLHIDGTLKIVGEDEDPDVLLTVEIVNYQRRAVRFTGATRPAEYRITVTVRATLHDMREDKDLFVNERLSGRTEFVIQGSLPDSETRAQPRAFDDLARNVVERIVEGW
ncbi:MAG: LptE family protein [Verrucomicrobia bacterium]|nr:LptE family protein [Verrucomicrobiota bacterium]